MALIAKPFITIHGDEHWFEQIVSFCVPSLPMEPTNWVRKRSSDCKIVHVDIDARRFDSVEFGQFDDSVLGSPLLHVFVIVENEDLYNSHSKALFSDWIGLLRSRSVDGWRLIVVPDPSVKSKNKFSINKFIINNRLRTDFNIQKIENRSIRLSDNSRERYSQIQKFLREIVLATYDDVCFKIEDKIRIQRETQFTPHWNYFDYFYLQEELADIYECLNLYEDSLAQFDESDAIFFKCLENFQSTENLAWINNFRTIPFENIDCLILTNYSDPVKRLNLSKGHLCLTDFRAYLLSRQCALLQLLNRYHKIPALVYGTLIKFLNECKILNMDIDSKLKNCWVFLTALQALQRFNPIDGEELLVQDYAALFRLALNSINNLALSLNIWVPYDTEWDSVNNLRMKLSILSNEEYGDTPSSRLAAGLESQRKFQAFHIKLFEEALTIWKHIGRIRSANLLGIQLADLYYKVEQYDKAEPLYIRAIKCLRNENWAHLAMPLRLKLAVCQKDKFENDPEKYLKTCIHLAGATFSSSKSCFNPNLSLKNESDHMFYFSELKKCVGILFDKTRQPQIVKLKPLFTIHNVVLLTPDSNGFQMIEVVVDSHLPQTINAEFLLKGTKFPELDIHKPKKPVAKRFKSPDSDIDEFPAQYSIPLTSTSSPKIYRNEKSILKRRAMEKDYQTQLSVEEELNNLNNGISVEIKSADSDFDEENGEIISLICFPKMDAGLRARRISISQDLGISFDFSTGTRKRSIVVSGKTTEFVSEDYPKNIELCPGRNTIILKSKEYGLYVPCSVYLSMFDEELIVRDLVIEEMLDESWTHYETIQTFLPSFNIDNPLDYYGFIDFQNQISPRIKMGLLSFPSNEIELRLYVNKEENFTSQEVADSEPETLLSGRIVSLAAPLQYTLGSMNDKVIYHIPSLIKREFTITSFEGICLSKNIFPTNSSKYIVSVGFQRSAVTNVPKCNYQIKNPGLKLHHQNDIRQLLNLAHQSLSTGTFNDNTQFTILWILETNDIIGFDKQCLKFTLTIDLSLKIDDSKELSGNLVHDFEIRNM